PLDQRAQPLRGQGHGGRRQRHGAAADAGLGPGPLPDLDGVAEDPGQALLGRALLFGRLEGVADLTQDLALAEDDGVDPGGHPEQVGDGRLVVVAVDVLGEVGGLHPGLLGQELRGVGHAGVELGAEGVDLGAVAGRQQGDLGQVLPAGQLPEGLGDERRRDRNPLQHRQGDRAVVQPDDDERHVLKTSLASSKRPARMLARMPESSAACQLAPGWASRRTSAASWTSTPYSWPTTVANSRRTQRATPGARPDVPPATSRSPRRSTAIGRADDASPSDATLTKQQAASAATTTARFTAGSSVAATQNQAPATSPASKGRRARASRPASAQPAISSDGAGATTSTRAPVSRRSPTRRVATRPPPTTRTRRPASDRLTGYVAVTGGPRTRRPGRRRPSPPGAAGRRTGSAARSTGRPCGATPRAARR